MLKNSIYFQYFPRWIAPNVMTFVGFLFTALNFVLLSYYDWNFTASTGNDGTTPIPNWVWLCAAFNIFAAYTLGECGLVSQHILQKISSFPFFFSDGIDGKQARRIGLSGPLGELFDHGLDSYTAILIPGYIATKPISYSDWWTLDFVTDACTVCLVAANRRYLRFACSTSCGWFSSIFSYLTGKNITQAFSICHGATISVCGYVWQNKILFFCVWSSSNAHSTLDSIAGLHTVVFDDLAGDVWNLETYVPIRHCSRYRNGIHFAYQLSL